MSSECCYSTYAMSIVCLFKGLSTTVTVAVNHPTRPTTWYAMQLQPMSIMINLQWGLLPTVWVLPSLYQWSSLRLLSLVCNGNESQANRSQGIIGIIEAFTILHACRDVF